MSVHTIAPLNAKDAGIWAAQFVQLDEIIDASPYPIVLAGDFNATLEHAPLDRLVQGEVRDAFAVAGSGFGATWPSWSWPMPSVMRIDHVLVCGALDVGSASDEDSIGSDHRRLVVELGIRDSTERNSAVDVTAVSNAATTPLGRRSSWPAAPNQSDSAPNPRIKVKGSTLRDSLSSEPLQAETTEPGPVQPTHPGGIVVRIKRHWTGMKSFDRLMGRPRDIDSLDVSQDSLQRSMGGADASRVLSVLSNRQIAEFG